MRICSASIKCQRGRQKKVPVTTFGRKSIQNRFVWNIPFIPVSGTCSLVEGQLPIPNLLISILLFTKKSECLSLQQVISIPDRVGSSLS